MSFRTTLASCLVLLTVSSVHGQLAVIAQPKQLTITNSSRPLVEFVFDDPEILRPYFTRAHSPSGILLTRHHPPVAGSDPVDHATMHPGLWLAWGDINGQDFWRNKASISHLKFTTEPSVIDDQVRFATESALKSPDSTTIGKLNSEFVIAKLPQGWLIVWQASLQALDQPLVLGDQEEMGFGVRMATALTEKEGGIITNATGLRTAAKTWGQPASWCDYAGGIDGRVCGITLLASPKNFRESWWHNRDYGLMVANPFGRSAMKQGEASKISVVPNESLSLGFAAVLHDTAEYDPAAAYRDALKFLVK